MSHIFKLKGRSSNYFSNLMSEKRRWMAASAELIWVHKLMAELKPVLRLPNSMVRALFAKLTPFLLGTYRQVLWLYIIESFTINKSIKEIILIKTKNLNNDNITRYLNYFSRLVKCGWASRTSLGQLKNVNIGYMDLSLV